MARPPRDPLVGIDRILVDGTNVLHAVRAGPGAAPPAALVGRLRAVIPAPIRIEILFDGPPEPGLRGTRIAHGVTVRYAGRLSADALAIRLVVEATGGQPGLADPPGILVVTDDGALGRELRARGAATIGTSWLIRRLASARLASTSPGRPRPPATMGAGPAPEGPDGGDRADDRDDDRAGWRPGRGATAKRGNPRRAGRGARMPR